MSGDNWRHSTYEGHYPSKPMGVIETAMCCSPLTGWTIIGLGVLALLSAIAG